MKPNTPASTITAPLFHRKYPTPDAAKPSQHKINHCFGEGLIYSESPNMKNASVVMINAPK
ncbi:MAG: hypothetical protein LBS26_03790 [Campylobacteraceae bacterium]|jgi:hypothetical protein|nr:hypothetical protein [Campylobacteraceae bacterium]